MPVLPYLWLSVQILAARRRQAVNDLGALSTEAVVITAALAGLAIVVVAIITRKVTARAESIDLGA